MLRECRETNSRYFDPHSFKSLKLPQLCNDNQHHMAFCGFFWSLFTLGIQHAAQYLCNEVFFLSFHFPEMVQSLPVPTGKVTVPSSRRRMSSSDSDPTSESPPKGNINLLFFAVFSNDCWKTIPKGVSTNHNIANTQMNQSELLAFSCNLLKAQVKTRAQVVIGFGVLFGFSLVEDWSVQVSWAKHYA